MIILLLPVLLVLVLLFFGNTRYLIQRTKWLKPNIFKFFIWNNEFFDQKSRFPIKLLGFSFEILCIASIPSIWQSYSLHIIFFSNVLLELYVKGVAVVGRGVRGLNFD